ncbi:hypothetical protein SEPCBS119000_004728 [Sporothrix epigloea]|uniref:Short-chain dehydrogenase n=1 Tax=Sporothrix epigloea TaxID=1892477 RepID=A0ABP0DWN1_9PEZI
MSRYAAVHASDALNGPGDARPTALEIIRDEKRENDFVGKVAVVTGCSSGLGPPTTEALLATGATVYCTARDIEKAKQALGPKLIDTGRVHILYMDHTDLATVKAAADELHRQVPAISILINNAGVMTVPTRTETKDGFELQIGTNHLAHFYFFCLLRDLLEAGSSPEFASRVVNVSSSGHRWGAIHLDDLQLAKEGVYTPTEGYANSKVANIYMANALDRKYGDRTAKAIHGYSLMPGGILTSLQRYASDQFEQHLKKPHIQRYLKSPEQGAATSIFAAVARELEGKGGVYLESCAVAPPQPTGASVANPEIAAGYAPWAFDPPKEEELWTQSLKLVGLPADF